MTDRAQSGGTLPNACPFLALEEDRDRRSAVPDGRHRCYAESSPHPRALTYQESYCLSAAFPSCRSFLDWAARAAAEPLPGATRPDGPVSVPLAPIPTAHPVPSPAPQWAAHPLPPVPAPLETTATRLPPPPPTYSPPPAWQPPGAVRPDPTTFTWATPPPWVAEPEMRSTASLPPTARPPLDPERPDRGVASAQDPWLDEDPAPFETWPPAPPSPTQVTGTFGVRRAADGLALVPPPTELTVSVPQPQVAQSSVPPQPPSTWPVEPVAIPVGAGPVPPSTPTGSGAPDVSAPPWSATPEPRPVPTARSPVAATPGPASGERRQPSSRWLPSFLSKDVLPTEAALSAVPARTGMAADASAGIAAVDSEPWADPQAMGPPEAAGPETWSAAAAPAPWKDPHDGAAVEPGASSFGAASATEAAGSGPAVAPGIDVDDAPGALAPRRRLRPGVPVDADAPAAVGSQTSGRTRTRGSGEWNRSNSRARSGLRRIIPGMVPPVALGAIVLFLVAAVLFFMPGFLAGGGAAPTPALTGDPALVAVSGAPRSQAPETPEPGDAAFTIYTVARGDTLLDIARRFAVTQEQLVCVNRELRRNPNLLSIGQELRIPPQDYECPSAQKTKKP